MSRFNWPLMYNNITRADADAVKDFLGVGEVPILTQSSNVRAFEQEWSEWLGVKYSVLVNSGAAANLLTLAALKWAGGGGLLVMCCSGTPDGQGDGGVPCRVLLPPSAGWSM